MMHVPKTIEQWKKHFSLDKKAENVWNECRNAK